MMKLTTSTNFRQAYKKRLIFFFICLSAPFLTSTQPTITAIKVNGKEAQLDSTKLELKASDDDLVFEFKPQSVDSFVFNLAGFDQKPVTSTFPTIRYTRLRGGDYTFEYGTKKGAIESLKKKLIIKVEEAWNETWWFYPLLLSVILIFVGIIIYMWVVYEWRQKLKLATVRTRIAGDLHDEIGSDLGSVVLSLKAIQNKHALDNPELHHLLEEVKKEAVETSISLRDSVWIIQPNNDSFERLFEKIQGFAQRLLNAKQIELIFDNQIKGEKDWKISMERRRNVYLIIREALHNIVKHSQATQVVIKINKENDGVRAIISDNGIGFDINEMENDGNGLLNFQQRAAESFIHFDLKSIPSVGTSISMFIPEL